MKAIDKIRRSFPSRVSFLVVLVTSIIFLLAIGAAAVSSHILIAEEATKGAISIIDATRKNIEKSLLQVETTVRCSARLAADFLDNQDYLYQLTYKITEEEDMIIGSAVALTRESTPLEYGLAPFSFDNGHGLTVSKDLATEEYDYFSKEWFTRPVESGEGCWSEPYYDVNGSEFLMSTYSVPVKSPDGKVLAVVTADVSLEWLSDIIESISPYDNSYATLTSKGGMVLSNSGKEFIAPDTEHRVLVDTLGIQVLMYSDRLRTLCVKGSLENGWQATVVSNYAEILKRTSRMHMILILIGLFGIAVLFVICYLMIRKLTDPLINFSSAVVKIGKGEFNTALPEIKSEDEIRLLRDSFDSMQKSLTRYIADLKTSTAANEWMQSELNIASKIQMAMLSREFPSTENIDLYAFLKPARQIGGDLYDFSINDGKLYFMVGDVSGKGVPASLVMAITRASFRFLTSLRLDSVQIVTKLNNAISDNNSTHMFVTLIVGILDLETGELDYCNAGHNPTLLIPADGEPHLMKAIPNLVTGLVQGFEYQGQHAQIARGTELVLYTDGVTEAENDKVIDPATGDKSLFSEERLLDWAAGVDRTASAKDITEQLHDAVVRFADGSEQNDDITIMTIKFK